jgi:hypothetical protein
MRNWIVLTTLLAATAHAETVEQKVDVKAAPPIETAPSGGLDPDVVARLDGIEQAIAPGTQLEELLDRALVTFESNDPFSKAQRDAAKPRTIAILTKIAERARSSGERTTAARALDARWMLSGGHDPQLATALVEWAERDAERVPAESLFLARRARRADPSNGTAADLDDELSSNRRAWKGRLMIVAGLAAFVGGLYLRHRVGAIEEELAASARPGDEVESMLATRDRLDLIGTGLLVAAPVLGMGGVFFSFSGIPSYSPTSPAALPALEGR